MAAWPLDSPSYARHYRDGSQRSRLAHAALLVLSVLAVLSTPAAAQVAPDAGTIRPSQWKAGYNGFAMLCRLNGLLVHDSSVDWKRTPPNKSLLIVLGRADKVPVNLTEFLARGGAVLIANATESRS